MKARHNWLVAFIPGTKRQLHTQSCLFVSIQSLLPPFVKAGSGGWEVAYQKLHSQSAIPILTVGMNRCGLWLQRQCHPHLVLELTQQALAPIEGVFGQQLP